MSGCHAHMQAFRGIAIDIAWEDEQTGTTLVLTAATPLQAGWQLQQQPLMEGVSFEALLMEWGPSAAVHAMQGVSPAPAPSMQGLLSNPLSRLTCRSFTVATCRVSRQAQALPELVVHHMILDT